MINKFICFFKEIQFVKICAKKAGLRLRQVAGLASLAVHSCGLPWVRVLELYQLSCLHIFYMHGFWKLIGSAASPASQLEVVLKHFC